MKFTSARVAGDSPTNAELELGTNWTRSLRELAEKVGLKTRASLPYYDLIIIGSGPAGLSAEVYASSEGLSCLVVERGTPGGQAGSSPRIENYLGFPNGISGSELALPPCEGFPVLLTRVNITPRED